MANKRNDGKPAAPRVPLLEGENSIDRVRSSIRNNYKVLAWNIRLPGHAQSEQHVTTGSIDATDGQLRAKAKRKAEDLLAIAKSLNQWTPRSAIADYIIEVVLPDINRSTRLSDLTKMSYRRSIRRLLADCPDDSQPHKNSLKRVDIQTAARFTHARDCLMEISHLHGAEAARQASTIYKSYILQRLVQEEVIAHNALTGAKLDLDSVARANLRKSEGVVSLDRDQYNRAVDYLLERDPFERLAPGKVGRWTLEQRSRAPRHAINITLLQAATGLRANEARQVRKGMFVDDGDMLRVSVESTIAKRRIPRIAYILESRIADRMRLLLGELDRDESLLFGQPLNPDSPWSREKVTQGVRPLYLDMYEKLGIDQFEHARSHVWRATLNTLLLGEIPDVMRFAQFGHSEQVNRTSYTNAALTTDLARRGLDALRR